MSNLVLSNLGSTCSGSAYNGLSDITAACITCERYATMSEVENLIRQTFDNFYKKNETESNAELTAENNDKDGMNMSVSNETKTVVGANDKGVITLQKYKSGSLIDSYSIIPDIKCVRIYKDANDNPRAIHLDFVDGTTSSAVLQENDNYDIDHAFSVCITKRLLDRLTNNNGHQAYNKLVRRARKVYENELKDAERREKEEAALKARLEKQAEKKRKREKRRAKEYFAKQEKAKDRLIEIQKEAILRALKEYRAMEDDLK